MKLSEVSKEASRKEREAQIGLANNAFGAAAGAVATRQAYRAAPKTKAALGATRTGRFMLRHKVNPKVAIPATGAALVGMQAANGLMDAQSAGYFTGELREMRQKKKAKQMAAKTSVYKKVRYYDPEAGRQRRVGIAEGVTGAGSVAGGALTYKYLKETGVKLKDLKSIPMAYRKLGGAAAATAAGAGLTAGIHRWGTSRNNRRWT